VADLLKPALREWLDQNLPAMVERMVAAEIAKIVGKKG
jgi:cell pole-organizing protein PopZ